MYNKIYPQPVLSKLLALFIVVFVVNKYKAQTLPVANFTYAIGANGAVNFTSTSTNTAATLVHQWYFGDGSTFFGGPTATHTYSANGSYAVVLALASTQSVIYDSTTKALSINNIVTGIDETSNTAQFEACLFPNPSKSLVTLQLRNPKRIIADIKLMDAAGKIIHPTFIQNYDRIEINLNECSAGIYFLLAQEAGTGLYYQNIVVVSSTP